MEKQEQKQIIKVCYHCGREGLQNIVYKHDERINYDEENYVEEYYTWLVLSCPVCKMVSLLQQYAFSEDTDERGQPIVDEKTIFPATTLSKNNIPKSILNAFESARKVPDPIIRLVALRRTLELICKDKGADEIYKQKNPKDKRSAPLPEMLKILADENILPETLSSSSWVVKELGNGAAHDESDISDYHMKEIASIVETIIHYLYELPAKIKRLKDEYLPEKEMLK